MRPRRRTLAAAAAAGAWPLLSLSSTAGAQTNITWSGAPGGLWSVPSNWMPNQVPNNTAQPVVAIVNTPGPLVDGTFHITGLTVNDRVLFNEGSNLGIRHASGNGDTFINGNGSLSIAPALGGAPAAIAMGGIGTLTLSGNGLISMGGEGTARILGSSGATLNNTSWRIIGEGNLIEGFVALRNNGTITAAGGTLAINAGPYVNTRLMSAAANSTLVLRGGFGTFENAGGTIHADGGHVQISNGLAITGGTLSTANGGSISPGGGGIQTFRLTDVTNTGHYVSTNASNTDLASTITNNGSFTVNGALRAVGTATLTGGGRIEMQPGSIFIAGQGGGTLVNANNTIRGSGNIGSDTLAIVNEADGVIHAVGSMSINPGTLGMGNSGVLSVAPGGTMVLSGQGGGSFVNDGGLIDVASTGKVRLTSGIEITGGTFFAEDDLTNPAFTVPGLDNATLRQLTLNASLDVIGTLIAEDRIDGDGNLTAHTNAVIRIHSSANLNLSSGVIMEGNAQIVPDPAPGPDGIPQLFNNGLIRGAGNIGMNGLQITNNGTIRADEGLPQDPGILLIDPSLEGCLNAGVMESTNFGVLQLTGAGGGTYTQTGMALIRALGLNSNVRLSGSQISITGGLFGAGAGSISVDGGTTATVTDLTSDAFLTTTGLATILINNNVNNTGTVALPGGARLVVAGASTLNSGSGHILNNGSITISNNGNLDANFIEGTGRTTVQGGGTLRAHAIRQNVLDVQAGGFAHLKSAFVGSADASRVGSLSVGAAPAFLDVANRVLVIDQSGTAQLGSVRNHIINGYNGGAWNGPGIRSGVAAANPGHGVGYGEASAIFSSFPANYFGQAVDSTTLLVTFTKYGDANLDRVVNLADFNRLAINFGQSNKLWTDGDFTYDGLVNLADFNRLAANFGLSAAGPEVTPSDWAALAAVVPEPAGVSITIISTLLPLLRAPRRGPRRD